MATGTCRQCGRAVEMTEEEANKPLWCCGPDDRICYTCWEANQARRDQ